MSAAGRLGGPRVVSSELPSSGVQEADPPALGSGRTHGRVGDDVRVRGTLALGDRRAPGGPSRSTRLDPAPAGSRRSSRPTNPWACPCDAAGAAVSPTGVVAAVSVWLSAEGSPGATRSCHIVTRHGERTFVERSSSEQPNRQQQDPVRGGRRSIDQQGGATVRRTLLLDGLGY